MNIIREERKGGDVTAVLNMDVLILNPSMVAFNSSTVALGTFAPFAMGLISTCSFRSGSSSTCA